MIGRLSMATAIPVATSSEHGLRESGHRPPLPTRWLIVGQPNTPTTPEPRFAPNYSGNIRAANALLGCHGRRKADETIAKIDAARRVEVSEHLLGADLLKSKQVWLASVDTAARPPISMSHMG
jgi:hypothetical protein